MLSDRQAPWLADFTWAQIEELTRQLCARTHSFHGPTSDGYTPCRTEWERRHPEQAGFRSVLGLLRECHRLSPFCFNNGNTFAAVARELVMDFELAAEPAALLRSAAGHYVAGVLCDDELDAMLGGFP